jgi:anhydro-N-acetylmuramic acid kinase
MGRERTALHTFVMRVLGIMSGTSIDAVDYVVCGFSREGAPNFEGHWQVRFPQSLRRRLLAAAAGECSSHEAGQLHHDLGRFYAIGARGAKVELVGLHGQTIFHRSHRSAPATLQIGESAYLAEVLKVPIVSNFRAADIAAGGQGAPLATLFHREVFAKRGKHIAVNNLGGISNVTSLDWRFDTKPHCLAFDTGPANMLIDLAVQRFTRGKQNFDRSGRLASRGKIDSDLLARWLKHRFFKQQPPKSTGREVFGERFLNDGTVTGPNLIATLTELTARSIALNYRLHLESIPDEVILCGGGAENPFLVTRIAEALRVLRPTLAIGSSADYGWPPQVIEGAAFALLAWKRWHNQPGNIPETTGADGPRLLGQISRFRPNAKGIPVEDAAPRRTRTVQARNRAAR